MALDPADVARRHVDEELMELALVKANEALRGLEMAQEQPDKDYLTAKAERWQKWAATAEKQMELKQ